MSPAAEELEFSDRLLCFQIPQMQHPHWAAEGKKTGASLQWVIWCSILGTADASHLSSDMLGVY